MKYGMSSIMSKALAVYRPLNVVSINCRRKNCVRPRCWLSANVNDAIVDKVSMVRGRKGGLKDCSGATTFQLTIARKAQDGAPWRIRHHLLVQEILAIQRVALCGAEAGVADDIAQLFFGGA